MPRRWCYDALVPSSCSTNHFYLLCRVHHIIKTYITLYILFLLLQRLPFLQTARSNGCQTFDCTHNPIPVRTSAMPIHVSVGSVRIIRVIFAQSGEWSSTPDQDRLVQKDMSEDTFVDGTGRVDRRQQRVEMRLKGGRGKERKERKKRRTSIDLLALGPPFA